MSYLAVSPKTDLRSSLADCGSADQAPLKPCQRVYSLACETPPRSSPHQMAEAPSTSFCHSQPPPPSLFPATAATLVAYFGTLGTSGQPPHRLSDPFQAMPCTLPWSSRRSKLVPQPSSPLPLS